MSSARRKIARAQDKKPQLSINQISNWLDTYGHKNCPTFLLNVNDPEVFLQDIMLQMNIYIKEAARIAEQGSIQVKAEMQVQP